MKMSAALLDEVRLGYKIPYTFRNEQVNVICAIASSKSVFCVLPTGYKLMEELDITDKLLLDIHSDQCYVANQRTRELSHVTNIEHVDKPISYSQFFEEYMLPNKACILGAWATEGWRSRHDWVTTGGQPNLNFMKDSFGETVGPVADCKAQKDYAQPKEDMRFSDYVDYLIKYRKCGYSADMPCHYMKDWHFMRAFPNYKAYSTPRFFQSDWLNEFWDSRKDVDDDYRFVYMGPKGSWTPFHCDVLRSYSWSANICGRKKWLMFPPGEEEYVKDRYGQTAYDLTSSELQDKKLFPRSADVTKRFEIYQEAGEVIFVPSGWFHQVFNVEDTISINHNWMNGCCIDLCWNYIQSHLAEVQRSIDDCKEMEGWDQQCQLILKASSGIDYAEFYRMLHVIGSHRLALLLNTNKLFQENCSPSPKPRLSAEETISKTDLDKSDSKCLQEDPMHLPHIVFDLIQIIRVVQDMLTTSEFNEIDSELLLDDPREFVSQLEISVNVGMESLKAGS